MEGVTGEETSDRVEPTRTAADLRGEFGKCDLPRHLALFYRSTATQLESVAAYLTHGLQSGHRCLYLTDVNARSDIEDALRAVNIDVERRLHAGDLVIRDASRVYLDSGFDPDRMITTLEEEVETSVSDGYEGLWMAGENSWCFRADQSFDRILDFEVRFDAICPDIPVTALCQYDLTEFDEESAAKALWTHEQVVYRHTICENPFYIPPEEYRANADSHLNAQLLLEQAYSLTRARREITQREQRLTVVNRVLRHNIRNDLNIVRGILQLLDETGTVSPENQDRLDTALDHTDAVLEMANKARHVQQTISDSTVEHLDLGSVVEGVVSDMETSYPDAEIRVSGPLDIEILADTNLDTAIREALRNGIIHQESDSPSVSLTVSIPAPDTVRIDVQNPGSIPDQELETIDRGKETKLQHGSGLGLWLITWIVENAHGTVQFPETEAGEALIRIELYRAPSRSDQ